MTSRDAVTIKDYPDYKITSTGKLYSKRKKDGWVRLHGSGNSGNVVYLYNDFGVRVTGIHILVLEMFTERPDGCDTVHHIDGDPGNNRIDNLMWMTSSDHGRLHGSDYKRKVKGLYSKKRKVWYTKTK